VLVAVPSGVVTEMGPLVALGGTTAVICTSESTEYVAAVALNVTAVLCRRAVPEIVTDVPTGPLRGSNPERVGASAEAGATGTIRRSNTSTPRTTWRVRRFLMTISSR